MTCCMLVEFETSELGCFGAWFVIFLSRHCHRTIVCQEVGFGRLVGWPVVRDLALMEIDWSHGCDRYRHIYLAL